MDCKLLHANARFMDGWDELTHFGTDHGQDQCTWRVLEWAHGEDTTANGRGDLLAKSNGTDELCDCR